MPAVRPAWYTTAVSTGPFTVNFRYTVPAGSNPPADGITMAFQTQGTTALGGAGGSLGYETIAPSAALAINIYPPNRLAASAVATRSSRTALPPGGGFTSIGPVDPGLFNQPTDVTVTYDGTNLNVTFMQAPTPFDGSSGAGSRR